MDLGLTLVVGVYKVRCRGGCDFGVHGEAPQRCSSTKGTSCTHCGIPTSF